MSITDYPAERRNVHTPADREECEEAGHEWRWHKNGLRVVHDCICCGLRRVDDVDWERE